MNRIGDKSRLFSVVLNILETEQFCPVLSAVWRRLQTSPRCILETGSRQDKGSFTLHFESGQNSFKIFCRRQSWLVTNSVYTTETVLSCLCRRCELGVTQQSSIDMSSFLTGGLWLSWNMQSIIKMITFGSTVKTRGKYLGRLDRLHIMQHNGLISDVSISSRELRVLVSSLNVLVPILEMKLPTGGDRNTMLRTQQYYCWWRVTANLLLEVSQPSQLSLSSSRGR